jgi:hypothetical protein
MLQLKRYCWKKFFRIRLGRRLESAEIIEMRQWCGEQPCKFYHSDGGEVWYFDDLNTAIYFKLRWY